MIDALSDLEKPHRLRVMPAANGLSSISRFAYARELAREPILEQVRNQPVPNSHAVIGISG
jgi:hypothetical protein